MSEFMDRRRFLGAAAATGIAAGLSAQVGRAASDTIVMAIVGTGGRGTDLSRIFAGQPGVEIAYVCDVDKRHVAKAAGEIEKIKGKAPKTVEDFRKILDDNAVTALAVATPNHWHAPVAILGCAAGKHVYVEKPCSYNPEEGELLVAAARKYRRLVQMGNQRRSMPNFIEAIQALRDGVIGRPYLARCWYNNTRGSIGKGKEIPVPDWLNFDLWQGPAPRRPYRSNLVHYNWHWFWHWGNGELGNNGIHPIDVCRWGLGVEFPVRVTSAGGRYQWDDDQQTPDTNVVAFDFPDRKTITWQGLSCNGHGPEPGAEVVFHGDQGTLAISGGGYTGRGNRSTGYTIYDLKNKEVKNVPIKGTDRAHMINFLDAIRSGKPLNSEIAEGHKSTLLCHLGNIAYRTGHTLHCDPKNGHILDDKEAAALWSRQYEKGWEPKV
jgi:predicted dehydrogenase